VHTYGTYQVAVAERHRRRTGIPFVLSAHFHPITSMHGGAFRRRLRAYYDHRIGGPHLRRASRLIVESHEEERLIASLGFPLPPVRIVPPGYTPLASPLPPGTFAERYGIPGPYVLFVGRLAPNKGLLTLVEAFRSLAEQDPEASLVLVGADGGMDRAVAARARALGLERRVHRVGHVEDEALVAGGLRDARLFALPSEYEAFGLVLLEAMAQGTPVIASRVGGIPEFVEDERAGLLVPPGDAKSLAEALGRLWSEPTMARAMGRYGRDTLVPRYSWEKVAAQFEQIYEEVRASDTTGRAAF
jgi:glycosyltransferase involved in cell wall biosynthesis